MDQRQYGGTSTTGTYGLPTGTFHFGKPITKTPRTKTSRAKTSRAKTSRAKMPIAKMPIAKMPIAKMPIAKMPIAKSPVRHRQLTHKPSAHHKHSQHPHYTKYAHLPAANREQGWVEWGLNRTLGAAGRTAYKGIKKATWHKGPGGNKNTSTSGPLSIAGSLVCKIGQRCIGLFDGTVVQLSPSQFKRREQRLKEGKTLTVYHRTDPNIAAAILSTQTFIRGSQGMVGGAIYFADNPRDTWTKAVGASKQMGTILKCKIKIGNVKYVSDFQGKNHKYKKWISGHQTFKALITEGYDSICYDRDAHQAYSSQCPPNIKQYNSNTGKSYISKPNLEWVIFTHEQVVDGLIKVHWHSDYNETFTDINSNVYPFIFSSSTWHNDDILNKNCKQGQIVPPDFIQAQADGMLPGQPNAVSYRNSNYQRKILGKKRKSKKGKSKKGKSKKGKSKKGKSKQDIFVIN